MIDQSIKAGRLAQPSHACACGPGVPRLGRPMYAGGCSAKGMFMAAVLIAPRNEKPPKCP